ncbi:MAG: type ISP restriction/modification enzyme [Steroidobacteraceae bacterium]
MSDKLEQIISGYFSDLRDKRGLGAGTPERSYYPAASKLLDAIGAQLKPKVLCLADLSNTGAGQPDFGLYVANQVQKGEPRKGQAPERGVIEMKSVKEDAWLTADTKQVSKYWGAYRLVIVTNLRDFLILGEDGNGQVARLESFRLAKSETDFWEMVATPQKSAKTIGQAFGEYLRRALTQSVALREPKDVAWFLASYGRDALQRVEEAGDLPALASIRSSLEQALGVKFEGDRGEHFFRSTLVQTLFYGVFSAWVLWAKTTPRPFPRFDWHTADWNLNVPFVKTLFHQLASPSQLQPLRLVEVLDWTAATLNRVDADVFIAKFNDADAVQYFYEPFLEAFDPELRKELGVWYTPTEVITYMVARVDRALREELGVADGLASEQVYVLDPCCGTGGYLAAVLNRIDTILGESGLGALTGQMVKTAATTRVFGFEILSAPFVVAHLKVGLVLKSLGATLQEHERAGIYLTNALTGWEPVTSKPLPFSELEEERKKADEVKQKEPILVILGNPPYNGFAGMAQELPEERSLSLAYRTTKRVRPPEGQGLNDLYVRFFRMAERRIVEKTGRGIVSFISNYSWLDGLSFTGMRERYLEAFDLISIDCLNGDKFKTGKTTPEGMPDPSIFSTEHNREGIQVGTAIATLVRKQDHAASSTIAFRHLWGTAKRQELLDSTDAPPSALYQIVTPSLELGLPYMQTAVGADYHKWPSLPELFPTSFPGVQTKRDNFLTDIDRQSLSARLDRYFDPKMDDVDFFRLCPEAGIKTNQYDPKKTRRILQSRGILKDNFVQFAFRPFDIRWIYWEPETGLLGRKVASYWPNVFSGNLGIVTQQRPRGEWFPCQVISHLGCLDLLDRSATIFPLLVLENKAAQPNLPKTLRGFLEACGLKYSVIFYHTATILHAPSYHRENAGALRLDWPRVPIPAHAKQLDASADLGAKLASLLEPDAPVEGVTRGKLRPGIRTLGLPYKKGGKPLDDADLSLSAGWGHVQTSGTGSTLVMPGLGLVNERDYTLDERAALEQDGKALGMSSEVVFAVLGSRTLDVHLNADAMWTNVPMNVWEYTLGGYQVIKKWLSYREKEILGRALKAEEVAYVSEMVRRIAAILLLGPALDANYEAAKANAVEWKDGRPVV